MAVSFKGAGSAFDPQNKSEVSEFTAALLTSGTKQLDEEAFNARTNDIAANLASASDLETSSVEMRSLSKPSVLKQSAALFNAALTRPRFDSAAFARLQKQGITTLQQEETDPGFIAGRTLTKLNYPDHPYVTLPSTTSAPSTAPATVKTTPLLPSSATSAAAAPKNWPKTRSKDCLPKAARATAHRTSATTPRNGATSRLPANRRKSCSVCRSSSGTTPTTTHWSQVTTSSAAAASTAG